MTGRRTDPAPATSRTRRGTSRTRLRFRSCAVNGVEIERPQWLGSGGPATAGPDGGRDVKYSTEISRMSWLAAGSPPVAPVQASPLPSISGRPCASRSSRRRSAGRAGRAAGRRCAGFASTSSRQGPPGGGRRGSPRPTEPGGATVSSTRTKSAESLGWQRSGPRKPATGGKMGRGAPRVRGALVAE